MTLSCFMPLRLPTAKNPGRECWFGPLTVTAVSAIRGAHCGQSAGWQAAVGRGGLPRIDKIAGRQRRDRGAPARCASFRPQRFTSSSAPRNVSSHSSSRRRAIRHTPARVRRGVGSATRTRRSTHAVACSASSFRRGFPPRRAGSGSNCALGGINAQFLNQQCGIDDGRFDGSDRRSSRRPVRPVPLILSLRFARMPPKLAINWLAVGDRQVLASASSMIGAASALRQLAAREIGVGAREQPAEPALLTGRRGLCCAAGLHEGTASAPVSGPEGMDGPNWA